VGDVGRLTLNVRWRAWQRLGAHPLYLQVSRRRPRRAALDAGTELLIDGFPRTGNTFAVLAFQTAQSRPVHVAHHLHISGHVVQAVRRGVPAVALIRKPEATVVSTMMWWPHVRARDALVAYTRFYARMLPLRDACVFADFDEVTSDFGAVVRRVNGRFGTEFVPFDHTPANVEHCYRLIEERSARAPWGPMIQEYMSGSISAAELSELRGAQPDEPGRAAPEMRVARPSAARDAAREALRERYRARRLERLRRRAERVYKEFVGA